MKKTEKTEKTYTINEHGMSKDLYDLLKEAGIVELVLHFSGGHDEGHLEISATYLKDGKRLPYYYVPPLSNFDEVMKIVEEAAEEGFSYCGTGDGNDYGDNYTYDLENNTVKHDEWYSRVEELDGEKERLEIV
jgi:hypothetical protein